MMNLDERDDTNDSSLGTPGEEPRATMVPPTSLSTYMLNIMKGIQPDHGGIGKGPGDSEISLTPMNLSTMLSSHSGSGSNKLSRPLPPGTDNSLSPRSPRPHQRDLEDSDTLVDSTDPRDRMQPGTGSSHGLERGSDRDRRHRHSSGGSGHGDGLRDRSHHEVLTSSADIKSQFLADLRRLGGGGNIPNNGDLHTAHAQAASSTTHSPPAPGQSTPAASQSAASTENENNLPPRKRKVSQEHVTPRSPYNGIHDSTSSSHVDSAGGTPVKNENNSADGPENNG